MSIEIIIIINGNISKNYSPRYFKKLGLTTLNLVNKQDEIFKNEVNSLSQFDYTIELPEKKNELPAILNKLIQNNSYIFVNTIAVQESDIELADYLNELFNKPHNDKYFRELIKNKTDIIKKFNQGKLPQPSSKLAEDIFYNVQTVSHEKKTKVIAIWQEKTRVFQDQLFHDVSELISSTQDKETDAELNFISQNFTHSIALDNGLCELKFILTEGRYFLINYNLFISDLTQQELLDNNIGYSMLTCYLKSSSIISDQSAPKKAKHLLIVSLIVNENSAKINIGVLPSYYNSNDSEINSNSAGEKVFTRRLYLTDKDKAFLMATYVTLRHLECLQINLHFTSHLTSNITKFYHNATHKKVQADTISYHTHEPDEEIHESHLLSHGIKGNVNKELHMLSHGIQDINRRVKPLDNDSTIQDIMRYYLDTYDFYNIKPKEIKLISMNTGNPAFLPFRPIVEKLKHSLEQENLEDYAKYIMQFPEGDFAEKIERYCHEEKILSRLQHLTMDNTIIGHGSTNLYNFALQCLIKNKNDIILITRPTYGLFIDPIFAFGGTVGFLDITENAAWKVQPDVLDKTIAFYNQKAFYDYILNKFLKNYKKLDRIYKKINLNEPLPLIPSFDSLVNINLFDDHIKTLNAYIDNISHPLVNKAKLRFLFPPRVRAIFHINPHNPTGAVYFKKDIEAMADVLKKYPDIYIIDDLSHWGIVDSHVEPAAFASIEGMFERTVTLMSLSKAYCVPGLRAGAAIGPKSIIGEMQYRLLSSSASASLPAILALYSVFSAHKSERDAYLKNNNDEYQYRRNLMAVLIEGINHVTLKFEEKIKLYELIVENETNNVENLDLNFISFLLSGIPFIKIMTNPQGCFFHLLDISRLIGAKIGDVNLVTSTDVRNAIFTMCQVNTLPGELSGNFFNYSLRFSFSLTPYEIYTACKKIHLFISQQVKMKTPSCQVGKQSFFNQQVLIMPNKQLIDKAILDKAMILTCMKKTIKKLLEKQKEILLSNYSEISNKLQKIQRRVIEINNLIEKLVEELTTQEGHHLFQNYIFENENWLSKIFPHFNFIRDINFTFLSSSPCEDQTNLKF